MNHSFRADLHCHTTCSDGTSTPSEVIELAYQANLQGLSITDHDNIGAYEKAMPLAQQRGLKIISGIEFSSVHQGCNIHILGYSFDLKAESIEAFCKLHRKRRINRFHIILNLLSKQGIFLNEEDFPPDFFEETSFRTIGRPHIAYMMMKKGYISSLQQAFSDYIGEGKPCYHPGQPHTVEETLDIIHQAKGFAVIAHPHLINNRTVFNQLMQMDFDGIEGYYAHFPFTANAPWIKIGTEKGWLITGGSDYHGTIKPHHHLGSSWVPEETFNILYHHFKKVQEDAIR
jgi:3',5'-nucleoside bisphosphate phosphatase